MKKIILTISASLLFFSCKTTKEATHTQETKTPFVWESANVYFLLTDRFQNGNPDNDKIINRSKPTGKLRGFEGGAAREGRKCFRGECSLYGLRRLSIVDGNL